MAAVRRNILANKAARDGFIDGITRLKREEPGVTARDLGIRPQSGTANPRLSTYDLFVVWHDRAMSEATPAGSTRNAAHRGPVFLPWHRWMLILLERNLQRVLNDATFGLPYWNWAADGDQPAERQPESPLWGDDYVGGNGDARGSVRRGPFGASSDFRIRVAANSEGLLVAVNRPLRRQFQVNGASTLPTSQDVRGVLAVTPYDAAPWDASSGGFRNSLEGWVPVMAAPRLHNRVHVWVGGDMSPASSPNDPVFFLNHCNVDRIWASWAARHRRAPYLPGAGAPEELFRHRINDPMYPFFNSATDAPMRPRDVLNVKTVYRYDTTR